jgi:N-acetylglutamate synthase-like GNAT family acetyltransferase
MVVCYDEANETVGMYALVRRSETEFELEHCWVDPDQIGKGIGRKLMEHVKEQMVRADITSLRIISDPNAAGFYERMGALRQGEYISPESGRHLPLFYLDVTTSKTEN